MPNKKWVTESLKNLPRKEEEKLEIIRFWNEFDYYLLEENTNLSENTNINRQQGKTKAVMYKEEVFDILHNAKERFPLNQKELHNIQTEIEDLTINFDEASMFKSVPNIIRILIRNNDK